MPLALTLRVSAVGSTGCAPLAGATVDVWHCDAAGVYSDSGGNTAGKKFLRGHQMTDANGAARFTTIYPGWYPGRAVHIHFKVRILAGPALGNEITSQLYFDEAVTDRVLARAPYSVRGQRTRNSDDGLYRRGGSRLMLALAEAGTSYAGEFHIGMKL
jgi:protocatechuate 3,4-dioxygenase beta subunit